MSTDRRLSLRTCVDLPMTWHPLTEALSLSELCESFELPAIVQLQGRLMELDTDLDRLLPDISNPVLVGALHLINAKLNLLSEAQQVDATIPKRKSIELSADGIGFKTDRRLERGSWIGIHLVLPALYHLLGNARINHCDDRDGFYWVGAELHDLDPATAKKLTRFVIGTNRNTK